MDIVEDAYELFLELSVDPEDEVVVEEAYENSNVLDTTFLLHEKMYDYWSSEIETHRKKYGVIKTRAERAIEASAHRGGSKGRSMGDKLIDSIRTLYNTGMGIKWSEVQTKIFNVFLDTCLPKIYGATWPEHKARVLKQRKLKRVWQEALVNLARRNGKTYVTAGTAAALLLCVPDVSIAIFSTGERTARMLMDVVRNMIKGAWADGSVVKESDYNIVQSNKEVLLLEGPDGTTRLLGCYPGSVRVTYLLIIFVSVCF